MNDDQPPRSLPSSQGSQSDSQSQDALDLDSVRALTRALDGLLERQLASAVAEASRDKLLARIARRQDSMDESISGFVGKADGLIIAGKLTVDAAARGTEALERAGGRLEETGQHLLMAREPTALVLPLRYRVLDFVWPYATVSARHVFAWAGSALGAGGGIALAWQAFTTWIYR